MFEVFLRTSFYLSKGIKTLIEFPQYMANGKANIVISKNITNVINESTKQMSGHINIKNEIINNHKRVNF